MRNLATVQRISSIAPIAGADRIELATVLGWKCVVKKDEFKVGDLCLYFEIDSFLPMIPEFEFLKANSYKNTPNLGEGYRIKTQKLRGQVSQGLVFSLDILNKWGIEPKEGLDVTEAIGVRKFELPPSDNDFGSLTNDLQYGIPRTSETRMQSIPDVISCMRGERYYITAKMDGMSVTAYVKDGKFGLTSHSREYDLTAPCKLLPFFEPIRDKLLATGKDIAVQGEYCGPGIEKNRIGLNGYEWYVFDVMDLRTHEYYTYEELVEFCKDMDFDMVPVIEEGTYFRHTFDELLEKANGHYMTGKRREGIVVRSQDNTYSMKLNARLSFKVLSNKYLLKNDL